MTHRATVEVVVSTMNQIIIEGVAVVIIEKERQTQGVTPCVHKKREAVSKLKKNTVIPPKVGQVRMELRGMWQSVEFWRFQFLQIASFPRDDDF